jgi:NAD+--asparagine ADP-ribosyltransferase
VKSARNPRYALHSEADKILAERFGVKPSLIKKFRSKNSFTWHEVEDMRTLQLVPTKINAKFGHLGGISEALKR